MEMSKSELENLRNKYPQGTRLKLLEDLADPYEPKKAGDILIVSFIDDIGSIHGSWESGGSIALIPSVDKFEVYK